MTNMTDTEVIAFARAEIKKVHQHGPRAKGKDGQEYVLLELDIFERLVTLAEAHLDKRGEREE